MREENHLKQYVSTNIFASRFGVKGETVRRNLCLNGNFLGVKPIKLPNGRLLWPDITPDEVVKKLNLLEFTKGEER